MIPLRFSALHAQNRPCAEKEQHTGGVAAVLEVVLGRVRGHEVFEGGFYLVLGPCDVAHHGVDRHKSVVNWE